MDILTYLALPIILACLIKSWSNYNARWLLSFLLILEIVSVCTHSTAMSYPIMYYAWGALLSILFLLFAMARKVWFRKLRKIRFFNIAYKSHHYTVQEAAISILFITSFLVNVITLIEVYAYSIKFISDAPFKLYWRDQIQSTIYILTCIAIISFSFRFSKPDGELKWKSQNYHS